MCLCFFHTNNVVVTRRRDSQRGFWSAFMIAFRCPWVLTLCAHVTTRHWKRCASLKCIKHFASKQPQRHSDPLHLSVQQEKYSLEMDISAEIRKIPLVTRFLCLTTLGVTGAGKIGIPGGYWIFFHPDLAFKQFQVCFIIHTWSSLIPFVSYGECIRLSLLENVSEWSWDFCRISLGNGIIIF